MSKIGIDFTIGNSCYQITCYFHWIRKKSKSERICRDGGLKIDFIT